MPQHRMVAQDRIPALHHVMAGEQRRRADSGLRPPARVCAGDCVRFGFDECRQISQRRA